MTSPPNHTGTADEARERRDLAGSALDLYDLAECSSSSDSLAMPARPARRASARTAAQTRRRTARCPARRGESSRDPAPEVPCTAAGRRAASMSRPPRPPQAKPARHRRRTQQRAVGVERLGRAAPARRRSSYADVRRRRSVSSTMSKAFPRGGLFARLRSSSRPVVVSRGVEQSPPSAAWATSRYVSPRCRHRLASDRHGAKRAVESAAHGGNRGAVERKRQVLHRGGDAGRGRRVGVV